MENITDADYAHAKRVCKGFEIKNLGEKLDPAKFLSASGLAWEAVLNRAKVKLDLLTDIDMLLMVEKGIRGRMCYSFNRYLSICKS